MAEQRFAEPIVTEDAIAASLLSLAQSLSDILEREGQGARLLEAAFFRADGKVERIAIRTGEPLRDPEDHAAAVARRSWMRWPIRWTPVSAST